MISFNIEQWNAYAPGMVTTEDWQTWFRGQHHIDDAVAPEVMKSVSPMLRRRFSKLGKVAMGAALPLLNEVDHIPSIFASRHGDTETTLSLLKTMGMDEAVSPTSFSLAVHNAVGGLYSIARKDTSPINAIAASEGLVVQALIESALQLQDYERVLCVIYDIELPELYRPYCQSEPFPHAVAMILGREGDNQCVLTDFAKTESQEASAAESLTESIQLVNFLLDQSNVCRYSVRGRQWQLQRSTA